RAFDVSDYSISLDIPETGPTIHAVATLIVSRTARADTLTLDLLDLTVNSVTVDGRAVKFARTDSTIAIPLPARGGASATFRVAVAPLVVYELGDTACGLAEIQRCVPQFVYTAPEQKSFSPGSFARAGEIVQLFSRLVGPFPYEKLAHLQSSTRFGGMENASAI